MNGPYYRCEWCHEDSNMHDTSDLRVFGEKLICDYCYDDLSYDEAPEQWRDLPPFVPAEQKEIEQLKARVSALEEAIRYALLTIKHQNFDCKNNDDCSCPLSVLRAALEPGGNR